MKLAYSIFHPPGDKQINAPPVVMLHGMLDSRKTWKYIAPKIALNTGRIVYIVDQRNHGDSPWSDDMDWSQLADDIGDFLKEHDIPKAVLVGHSMGGVASFTFAFRKPEMVEKLVVEDISTRAISVKGGRLLLPIIDMLKECLNSIPDGADEETSKKSISNYMRALLPENESLPFSSIDFEMIPLGKIGGKYRWLANLDSIENFLSTDKMIHDVSKAGVYGGDSLFIYGTKSLFKVDKDPLIDKLFLQARKVGFEGGNHLIHHMYPKKFVKLVSNFINNTWKPISKI